MVEGVSRWAIARASVSRAAKRATGRLIASSYSALEAAQMLIPPSVA